MKFNRELKDFGVRTHKTNVEHGFIGEPEMMDKVMAKLALIHSEVTEVLEALRKNEGKDKVTHEIGDILVRTCSVHEWLVELDLATDDLDETLNAIMDKNDVRPHMHGHRWG